MRRLLAIAAVSAVLAGPAAGADLNPRLLVLQPSDTPAGFRLDRAQSGVRSNARRAKDDPKFRSLITPSGRLTGYEAEYMRYAHPGRSVQHIESIADVFRRPEGATMVLDWYDAAVRQRRPTALRRSPAHVGAEGWIYTGRVPGRFTLVTWRYGRVFAAVFGLQVPRDQMLELARAQQRRIVATLR